MTVNLNHLMAIDVETSGPNPYEHRLLAVAFAPFAPGLAHRCWYIRHDTITWTEVGRQYFQKYRSDWEQHAVRPEIAALQISEWLAAVDAPELMLVGHNVGFDYAFLRQLAGSFPKLSHRTVDTHTLLRLLSWQGRLPVEACSSSGALQHFGVEPTPERRHTAPADAEATRLLFLKLLDLHGVLSGITAGTLSSAKQRGAARSR